MEHTSTRRGFVRTLAFAAGALAANGCTSLSPYRQEGMEAVASAIGESPEELTEARLTPGARDGIGILADFLHSLEEGRKTILAKINDTREHLQGEDREKRISISHFSYDGKDIALHIKVAPQAKIKLFAELNEKQQRALSQGLQLLSLLEHPEPFIALAAQRLEKEVDRQMRKRLGPEEYRDARDGLKLTAHAVREEEEAFNTGVESVVSRKLDGLGPRAREGIKLASHAMRGTLSSHLEDVFDRKLQYLHGVMDRKLQLLVEKCTAKPQKWMRDWLERQLGVDLGAPDRN